MLTVERLVAGSRDVVALHEALGKVFRAFQHGTGLRRTDDRNACRTLVGLELIINATHQGVFGSYDHHVDIVLQDEFLQIVEFVDADGHVLAVVDCSGIAGRNEQLLAFRTLGNLPCQRMLTAAASQQQDSQAFILSNFRKFSNLFLCRIFRHDILNSNTHSCL